MNFALRSPRLHRPHTYTSRTRSPTQWHRTVLLSAFLACATMFTPNIISMFLPAVVQPNNVSSISPFQGRSMHDKPHQLKSPYAVVGTMTGLAVSLALVYIPRLTLDYCVLGLTTLNILSLRKTVTTATKHTSSCHGQRPSLDNTATPHAHIL